MGKLFRNRIFLSILSLVIAGIIAFAVLPNYYKNQETTMQVVVAAKDIPEGTVITGADISVKEVGAYGLSADVAVDKHLVEGMCARADIYAGEYVNSRRLCTEEMYKSADYGLNDGEAIITVALPTTASGVVGLLRDGDLVDMYNCYQDETHAFVTEQMYLNVPVLKVLNSEYESLKELEQSGAPASDLAPAYIMVKVTDSQARNIFSMETARTLRLALVQKQKG